MGKDAAMRSVVEYWNDMYRNITAPVTFGGGGNPSSEVVELASRLPDDARVIDIGCGDGRHALYLAAHGYATAAIDFSAVGIAKLQHFAADRGLSIHAQVADIRHYVFDTEYDGMVCLGTLHLIKREQWQSFLLAMKEHTKPGGYHVVGAFTARVPAPDDQKGHYIGLFQEEELLGLYDGWEVISHRGYEFHDEHPGGIRHHHAGESIVARKP